MSAPTKASEPNARRQPRTKLRKTAINVAVGVASAVVGWIAVSAVLNVSASSSPSEPDTMELTELGFTDLDQIVTADQPEVLRTVTSEMATTGVAAARWHRSSDSAALSVSGSWETVVTTDGHVIWQFHDLTVASSDEHDEAVAAALTDADGPVTLAAHPTGTIDATWELCDAEGSCLPADARAAATEDELAEPLVAGASVMAWEAVAGRVSPWQPSLTAGLLDADYDGPRKMVTASYRPPSGDTTLQCLIAGERTDEGTFTRSGSGIAEVVVLCSTADGRPVVSGPLHDDGAGTRLEGLVEVTPGA